MATMKDVSKLAGVGHGTVSRVVNNTGSVDEKTRKKVLDAIKKLNYVPNEVARNFKSKSTKMVGLMLPTVNHPFFSELAFFVENELFKNGYKMILCNSGSDKEKEIEIIKMLRINQVAGIITISYHSIYSREHLELPIVTIDRYISNDIPHIAANNYQGGLLATESLVNGGSTKLAYVGQEPTFISSVSDRKIAFIDIASKNNIPFVIYENPKSKDESSDKDTADSFVDLYSDVDGVFANTDLLAAAIIKKLRSVGKRVPEDVQVVGFDGIQKNDFFAPILTTIVQPIEKIGKKSVELLLNLIEGNEVQMETILDVEFREGETCKKNNKKC